MGCLEAAESPQAPEGRLAGGLLVLALVGRGQLTRDEGPFPEPHAAGREVADTKSHQRGGLNPFCLKTG